MSTLQFPANPAIGDTYDWDVYKYVWDGEKWKTKGIGYNPGNDLKEAIKQPFVTQINIGSFAVGLATLVSVPFRPRAIQAVVTQPSETTVRQSIGTGTFELDGSIRQYNNYSYDGCTSVSGSLIRMDAAGGVNIIKIGLAQPEWNPTTQLWDVKVNVIKTNGAPYWGTFTISP